MGAFYERATPPHRATNLRIQCDCEGGRTGRYRLTAYQGDRWIAANHYAWNVWFGHACGSLLVDDFIDYAEAQARSAAMCSAAGG